MIDKVDQRILQELSANARVTGAEIARKIHLSLPAVTERLRKLDRSGVIDRYTIRYKRELLGLKLLAFIRVWLEHTMASSAKDAMVQMPEVLECHHVAGDYDLLLKVLVYDAAELETLLAEKIKGLPGVARTSTTIVLSSYKEEVNRGDGGR